MARQTFPITRAKATLESRLFFVVLLLLIAFMIYMVIDSGYIIMSSIIVAPGIMIFIYALFGNWRIVFTIANSKLHIARTAFGKSIDISSLDLENAKIIDLDEDANKDLRSEDRSSGVGLRTDTPSNQAGWFRLQNQEKALLFITNNQNVLYIPTHDDYVLMLSVENPEKFLTSLKHSYSLV